MNLDERLRAYRDGLERAIDEQADSDIRRGDASAVRPHDRSRVVVAVAIVAVVAMLSSAIVGLVHHFDASTNGPLTIEAITATTLGQSARVATTFTFTDDPSQGTQSGVESTGVYDFDHNVARVEQPPPTPTAGGPTATGSTVVLWVDGTIYSNITASVVSGIPSRALRGKRWIAEAAPAGAFGVENPFTALQQIRGRATSLVDLGVTHVDGRAVHHYHAIEKERLGSSTSSTSGAPTTVRVGYDLYVDGHRRLVRLVIAEPTIGSLPGPVQRLDFSDYGVHVDVVAPPADQVLDFDDVNLAFATPRLTGPWSRVASGTTDGYAWKLYRAPADHERMCWSFEPSPSLPNTAVTPESIIGGPPPAVLKHDGVAAVCSRTGVWASPLQYIFEGAHINGSLPTSTLTSLVVAVVDDEVASVDNHAVTGASRRIAIDDRFGGFVDVSFYDTYTLHLRDGRTVECSGHGFGTFGSNSASTCPSLGG